MRSYWEINNPGYPPRTPFRHIPQFHQSQGKIGLQCKICPGEASLRHVTTDITFRELFMAINSDGQNLVCWWSLLVLPFLSRTALFQTFTYVAASPSFLFWEFICIQEFHSRSRSQANAKEQDSMAPHLRSRSPIVRLPESPVRTRYMALIA